MPPTRSAMRMCGVPKFCPWTSASDSSTATRPDASAVLTTCRTWDYTFLIFLLNEESYVLDRGMNASGGSTERRPDASVVLMTCTHYGELTEWCICGQMHHCIAAAQYDRILLLCRPSGSV